MHATLSRTPRALGLAAASALLFLLDGANAFAEPAGRVLFVTGSVTATDPGGSVRALERAAYVEEGDVIATGEGRVQIEFKDGGYFSLHPNTRFRVERYRYAAAGDAEDSVVVGLLKGGLRTISGLVGKRNRSDYRVDTGVATIGIRGTDYALDLNSALTGNVADGAIEVCNGAGCLTVQASQAFFVPSLNQAPVLGERRALLPPTAPRQPGDPAPAAQEGEKATRAAGFDPGQGGAFPELPAGRAGADADGGPAAFDRLPAPAAAAAGAPSHNAAPALSPVHPEPSATGVKSKTTGTVRETPAAISATGKPAAPGPPGGSRAPIDPPGLAK